MPDHHLARHSVSHVCHQWREIALNQRLLWSHVNFTTLSLAGAAEILVRAKSVPLCLEANLSSYRWDDVRFSIFRKELQEHVHHLRHLKTSAEPAQFHSILKGLISPAPTLEYLSLASRDGRRSRTTREQLLFIPDTLFDGSTPRLSWLKLRKCNISWRSPLLKGLKYLEISTPSTNARPNLAVWLDALDEMSQLKTLTLHSASPIAPSFPFDIVRTVTLPSLTRLELLASPEDCSLALAHLDLPALTCLCLSATFMHPNMADLQNLVPYVARHAHGPQDTLPPQSVLIRSDDYSADILAWAMPNIGDVLHDPPNLIATTHPTRVALSFRSDDWLRSGARSEILKMAMTGLPLNGLVTLAVHSNCYSHEQDLITQHFWPHVLPKWSLLQRVILESPVAFGFAVMLLEDDDERPLLPSLTELVVVDFSSYLILSLRDALMKRVAQGVQVQTLDLRMCTPQSGSCTEKWLRSLSEIVVDVLVSENIEAREQMMSNWKTVARGTFQVVDTESDDSREENRSDTDHDGIYGRG